MIITFHANPQQLVNALGENGAQYLLDKNNKHVGESVGESVGENTLEDTSSFQERIVAILQDHPTMSARNIGEILGVSSRKIERNIAKLKGLGILRRVGAARGGYWELMSGPSRTQITSGP